RRTVAEQVAAPAGEEVEITITLIVPDVGAFAADQADGIARVVRDHIVFEELAGFRFHGGGLGKEGAKEARRTDTDGGEKFSPLSAFLRRVRRLVVFDRVAQDN